jgi:cellulose synthase/poly-beta-1,6-N-acetylglucosamine synthase-like glycosyltransferase
LAVKPRGPAYARNRGFEVSRGEVVVFLDADVCVYPDTLSKFAAAFRNQLDVAAVFGAYDARPPGSGVVSQFRNLMHHYVHQCNSGEAETFWAGCGAIRATLFAEVGMFDEWHYSRPQIEDIELGRRLRQRGYRILLRPEIQCTHLKRWTLRNMLSTDLKHRGVPWMWLLLREGPSAGSRALNLRTVEKWCTGLISMAAVGVVFSVLVQAVWPLFVSVPAIAVVLILNRRFYRYLCSHRGLWFTVKAVPLHLLFYATSGLSAFSGWLMNALLGEPSPQEDAAAQAQLGIKTWPPGPVRLPGSVWDSPAIGITDASASTRASA